MNTQYVLLMLSLAFATCAEGQAPPVSQAPAPEQPALQPPPPSTPAKLSAAELEKVVAPIALYPDPLIATILPAAVYPLEIVQAAIFLEDTNDLPMLDAQPCE